MRHLVTMCYYVGSSGLPLLMASHSTRAYRSAYAAMQTFPPLISWQKQAPSRVSTAVMQSLPVALWTEQLQESGECAPGPEHPQILSPRLLELETTPSLWERVLITRQSKHRTWASLSSTLGTTPQRRSASGQSLIISAKSSD